MVDWSRKRLKVVSGVQLDGRCCEYRFFAIMGLHDVHLYQVRRFVFCSFAAFTALRWYQGTVYAENTHRDAQRDDLSDEAVDERPDAAKIKKSRVVMKQIEKIRVHRHWGQPFVRVTFPQILLTYHSRVLARVVGFRSLYGHHSYKWLVGVCAQRLENWSVFLHVQASFALTYSTCPQLMFRTRRQSFIQHPKCRQVRYLTSWHPLYP